MVKNFSILVIGVLIGMGVMRFIQIRDHSMEESARIKAQVQNEQAEIEVPEIDTDFIYEGLVKEKREESGEKYWFDETLEEMSSDSQNQINKMNSAGDEAAKMFEQFSSASEALPAEKK